MHTIRKSVEIKAPVQRVFDFMNEPSNLPSIWPNLVSVSNVATRPDGAFEFDWIYKMAGMHFNGHSKSDEVQSAKLVRVTNQGGIPSTFRWTYEGLNGAGTRLNVEVEYSIPTPVVGRIAEALVSRINERDMETVLANLKDVMESQASGVSATTTAH